MPPNAEPDCWEGILESLECIEVLSDGVPELIGSEESVEDQVVPALIDDGYRTPDLDNEWESYPPAPVELVLDFDEVLSETLDEFDSEALRSQIRLHYDPVEFGLRWSPSDLEPYRRALRRVLSLLTSVRLPQVYTVWYFVALGGVLLLPFCTILERVEELVCERCGERPFRADRLTVFETRVSIRDYSQARGSRSGNLGLRTLETSYQCFVIARFRRNNSDYFFGARCPDGFLVLNLHGIYCLMGSCRCISGSILPSF